MSNWKYYNYRSDTTYGPCPEGFANEPFLNKLNNIGMRHAAENSTYIDLLPNLGMIALEYFYTVNTNIEKNVLIFKKN